VVNVKPVFATRTYLLPPFETSIVPLEILLCSPALITVAYGSGARYTLWDGTGNNNQLAITYGSSSGNQVLYTPTNSTALSLPVSYNNITNRPNIMVLNSFGYNVTGDDVNFYINSIATPNAVGNYIRQPTTDPATPKRFGIFTPSGGKYVEIIIYNQSGKSREQIDEEIKRLYNEYLLIRHPLINQY